MIKAIAVLENINKVSNPLTIVALFAALAEASAIVVLLSLDGENQRTFLWFVMFFTVLLVLLFFGTLNFNHKVLYAPSDFRSDESFLASSFRNTKVITHSGAVQAINFGTPTIKPEE